MSDPIPPLNLADDPGEMALVLVDSLPDPIYVLDRAWRITFCNDAFLTHMGRSRTELIGFNMRELLPALYQTRLEEAFDQVMATRLPDAFMQKSVIYPERTMDCRVFPVLDGVAVVLRNVSRRVAAERALATSEEHLRRALSAADMGDWRWDEKADQLFMSEQMLALYGLGPEHQGLTRSEVRRLVMHPEDLVVLEKETDDAYAVRRPYEVEFRVRHGSGWRWMRGMGGAHLIAGQIIGMHGLVQDIHQRKLAAERLQAEIEERERAQQHQLLLIHELNHRVKNILAMVQAIAMQTLSTATGPQEARRALEQRLIALAGAHDVLTRESWDSAELSDIIAGAVAPHEADASSRFRVSGPRVRLTPKTAVTLALALHELATNAVKYGALSSKDGWVSLAWTTAPAPGGLELRLNWTEHGGPIVSTPSRQGFGSRLITRSFAAEQGEADLIYAPDGVRCVMRLLVPVLTGLPESRRS